MSLVAAEQEFAQRLGTMEGQDFQDEVCRFLRRSILDFQHIPPKPHGDGSLDGLSHGQSIAYCCYGPEQEPSKVKAKGLAPDIVNKFRDDMRALFEVTPKGRGAKKKLVHCPNKEIPTILAPGKQITQVRLIVSVLDTHRVVGPLNAAFDEYRAASSCTYVSRAAGLTIWSPKELATVGPVDDATIVALEHRQVLRRLSDVLAQAPTAQPASTSDFDAKFDWLLAQSKGSPNVAMLRSHFMAKWIELLTIETELANTSVGMHQALLQAREEAAVDAVLESAADGPAASLVQIMRDKVGTRLGQHLATRLPPEMRTRFADGEVARLIGECPIDWRK